MTREEVEKLYHEIGWDAWIERVSKEYVLGKDYNQRLYHLSLRSDLQGKLLVPKPATATNTVGNLKPKKRKFNWSTEIAPVRISTSPTIEECYYSIFVQIKLIVEQEMKIPEGETFQMYLYEVDIKPDTVIITNDTIVRNKMIYDAHVSKEAGIISPVKFKNRQTVRFVNNFNSLPESEYIMVVPYQEPDYKPRFMAVPPEYYFTAK